MEIYHIQQTIGGWKQNPMFSGTLKECQDWLEDNQQKLATDIVADEDLVVDYLP
jgi:hypothetical protein